jgi:hypothetical protein
MLVDLGNGGRAWQRWQRIPQYRLCIATVASALWN